MRILDRWRGRPAPGADGEAAAEQDTGAADVRLAFLRTAHDTFLSIKGGRLDQTRRARGRAVLVWEPGGDLGLLVGHALDEEFELGPSTPRALAHLVKLHWTSEATVAVADLWTRTWLAAVPPETDARNRIRLGQATIGPEETFTVTRAESQSPNSYSEVASAVHRRVRSLHTGGGVRAAHVIGAITDSDVERARALISTMLPLLSRDDLMSLGQAVVSDESLVSTLAAHFPDDPWASRSLPELYAWLQDPDAADWRIREVGTDLDVLWPAGPGDVAASSGETLAFAARAGVRPRRRSCVVATARNEGIYLVEWVAYYRALGVDELFVYSNTNDDNSDALLRALAEAGEIRWLDSKVGPGTKAQAKAYAHAFSVLPDVLDFEWALTLDIDEYLVLDPLLFGSLADFLDWHTTRQTDVIAVNWVVVGPSGLTRWEDDLVTRRFAARIAPVDAHIKSISRPTRILGSQPHFPYTAERERLAFREATGEPHTWFTSTLAPHLVQAQSDRPTTSHAALHHYALKSAEEFLWKFSRNRGGRRTATAEDGIALTLEERFLQRFLGQYDKDEGDIRPAVEATVPGLEREVERLRGLPGVAEAEQLARETFVVRSARVLDAYQPVLTNEFGEGGRRLLRLLNSENGRTHAASSS